MRRRRWRGGRVWMVGRRMERLVRGVEEGRRPSIAVSAGMRLQDLMDWRIRVLRQVD
jgi:hypothetical protein